MAVKVKSITVSAAARNFGDCVNQVCSQNATFRLLKNGKSIARLIPDHEKVCYGRDLAKVLENLELPVAEAKGWRRDLRAGRMILKAPVDKWR